MDVNVRTMIESDIPAVLSLLHEFAVFEDLDHLFYVPADKLHEALFGPDAFVDGLLAVDGDKPAGYALFFPEFASFRGLRGYYVEDLFVLNEYRGRGIGEMMLREIARRAASRGFE